MELHRTDPLANVGIYLEQPSYSANALYMMNLDMHLYRLLMLSCDLTKLLARKHNLLIPFSKSSAVTLYLAKTRPLSIEAVYDVTLNFGSENVNDLVKRAIPCFENEELDSALVFIKFCKENRHLVIRVLEPTAHLWVIKIMGLDASSVKQMKKVPKALVPLNYLDPRSDKDKSGMKLYLVDKSDQRQVLRTYEQAVHLQSVLDNVEARAIIDDFRFVRMAEEPTEEILSMPLVWHRFKFTNPLGNPYKTFDLYSRLITYLTSQAKQEGKFCGYKFFSGLAHLRELKFEQTREVGVPQIWFCLGLDPKISEDELRGLERNLKAFVMGLVMHTETTDGVQSKLEEVIVSCGKVKEKLITNDGELASILMAEVGFESFKKPKPHLFMQNVAAMKLWSLIPGLHSLIILVDFTLTSPSDLAMLIFRLYETLSTSILYSGVRVGLMGEPIIYSNFISYIKIEPVGYYRFHLRLLFEHPNLQEGMLKMLGIRVALEVFLLGYDAQRIEVKFGVVESGGLGKMAIQKFEQVDPPVKAREFRYITATEKPKAQPKRRNGKGGQKQTKKTVPQKPVQKKKILTNQIENVAHTQAVSEDPVQPGEPAQTLNPEEEIILQTEPEDPLKSDGEAEALPLLLKEGQENGNTSSAGPNPIMLIECPLSNEIGKIDTVEQDIPDCWISTRSQDSLNINSFSVKPLPAQPILNTIAKRRRLTSNILLEFK